MASGRSESTAADRAAETVAAVSTVVPAEGAGIKDPAGMGGVVVLLDRLIAAEAVGDDYVVFVDAALHLGLATGREHGQGGRGQEGCGDLG